MLLVDGNKNMLKLISKSYFLFFCLVYTSNSFAQVDKISGMIGKSKDNVLGTFSLFRMFFYLIGIILGIQGLFKLKAHLDGSNQVTLQMALLRLLAGAFFMALPTLIIIIKNSLFPGSGSLSLYMGPIK